MSVLNRLPKRASYGLTVLMLTNLVVAVGADPAAAEESESGFQRTDLPTDEPVEATPVEPGGQEFVDPSADQVWDASSVLADLPEAGSRVFQLGGVASDSTRDSTRDSGGFPVRVSQLSHPTGTQSQAGVSRQVTVEVFDRATAEEAGVSGLLFQVTGDAGAVELAVDYRPFAELYGGGWASRLRLLALPACAASTPQAAGCLRSSPVSGANNRRTSQMISARVQLGEAGAAADDAAGTRVFAVVAAASEEDGGDYRATDLSPAGSWSAGGNDGSFTYSYPLRVPPAAGPTPSLSLGYSSATHDGRTSGRNNQASWVGDGWNYQPGFIERSYKPCSLDDEGGSNNPDVTGDQCWDGDDDSASMTMSLNGTNTALVRDDDTGDWHAADDANWRIEKLGSPAESGDATSERWIVTTPDGTSYFFASEVADSGSRWRVPVFGNHTGEPCHASEFADSSCRQAWRWMVDKVVDVHGNVVRYVYDTETGHYGAAGDADDRVSYDRAGWLERIEYGLRDDDAGAPATGRVLFDTDHRCLADDCGTLSDPTEENWPDTPWDLHCDEAPCTSQLSPAFFSTGRLAQITTQVSDGDGGWRDVDTWRLEHEFKDYGDEEQVVLWLSSIEHTGHVGDDITMPKVEFAGEALPNRVDAAAGVPVMWRWRMASIKTETGAVITVGYADAECGPGDLPGDVHANAMRCYPVRWTPEFHHDPIEDWFHKHVVTSVVETDTTGGSVAVETSYDYSTAGGGTSMLWAFDDSEFTEDEHRTYGMWRGYPQVTTRVGDPAGQQTTSRARFYRGLDGQPLPSGGERSVSLTDAEGNTVTDHEALAGRVWEQLSYDGSTVIEGSTFEYWTRNSATRARDHDGGDLHAWMARTSVEKTRRRLTSSDWQRTETRTSYDSKGRATEVDDLGDTAESGDEQCIRTEYVENATAWIFSTVARSETVGVDCDTTPDRPDDLVSDTLMFHDGADTHGATPTKGLTTRLDVLDEWDSGPVYVTSGRTAYDSLGRLVESSDALERTTTTSYTPAGPGPVTEQVVTNPLGHQTTTELEPAWGAPTAETGPNGRRTDLAYDALGRSTAVWLPGREEDTQTPSKRFEYLIRDDAPSAVTSETLNHLEDYVIDIVIFDSLLRERQTQTETADHGRLLTENIYDTHGRVEEERGPSYHTDPPDTELMRVEVGESARRTVYVYDDAGRIEDEIFYNRQDEKWRTTTSYGGSSDGFMTTTQPPHGAPAKATITDAREQTVEKRTYHSNTPTGDYDALTYEHTTAGQLARMTDTVGNEWSWQYDLRGRQTTAVDPDAGTTTMTYDAAGQLTSTTDGRGETLAHDYDDLGRMTARHDGDGTLLAEWEYDTAIDGIGTLAKSTRWHDGEAYVNQNHAVNDQGLVVATSIVIPDSEGQLAGRHWFTRNSYPNNRISGHSFFEAGDADGGQLFQDYDHVGNPTRLEFHSDHTGVKVIVDEATYTPFDEIRTRTFGASYERQAEQGFAYEEDTRRLARATFDREASIQAVADLRYTYDDAGNILSIADVPEDLPRNQELQCFQYDHQRRLTEAWAQDADDQCSSTPSMSVLGGPAPYWHSYDHDATGNRTSETLRAPGEPVASRTYTYPDPGQPQPHALEQVTTAGTGETTSYAYDEAGNTTSRDVDGQAQTLSWNAEGKVESVEDGGDTIRMVYDADGNRLIRDDGDQVTAYMPHTELTWDRASDTLDGTRYFSHNGAVVAICTGRDVADWTWMGSDHHGSTTTHAINAFTAVEQVRRMDPYGNPRGPAPHDWPGQQSFVGGVEDPTGLIHIGARSYDPTTGRFVSVDPILALGDDQQINGYAYAHNNPITYTDPTGLCAWDGYNLCPGMDASQQPTFHDDCESYDCGVGNGGSSGGGGGGTDNGIVQQGTAEYGTTWATYDDGTSTINGWELPAGAGNTAELAAKIDRIMHDQGMDVHETYAALTWYCEGGPGILPQKLNCSSDFYAGVTDRNMDLLWGETMEVIELVGPGFVTLFAMLNPAARAKYCRNSFVPGTLVLLADGTEKPIEEVEVGDLVYATDPVTGRTEAKPVTATIDGSEEYTLIEITVASETAVDGHPLSSGNAASFGLVVATAGHPFWVDSNTSWTDAVELQPGDRLTAHSANSVHVVATTMVVGTLPVHNLTVADIHTYYVIAGKTPVLAHNCGALRINEGPVPEKVITVLDRVDAKGSPPAGYKGGREFVNDGSQGASILPRRNGVTYREWDVNPNVKGVGRGGERLITGSDGSAWYTNDHYQTFFRVR